MSQQRQRARSSKAKQGFVKVNHLSKRLPEDFFIPKALSSSPKKRENQIQPQQEVKCWYERDQSSERSPNKEQKSFIRRKKPLRLYKVSQQIQNVLNINQNKICKPQVDRTNPRQNIILKALKQTQKQSRVKLIKQTPVLKQPQKQSRQRIVKSQNKRYRKVQMVSKQRENIVREARMSLRESQSNFSPSRYQKMNLGFDGLLTFNRFD